MRRVKRHQKPSPIFLECTGIDHLLCTDLLWEQRGKTIQGHSFETRGRFDFNWAHPSLSACVLKRTNHQKVDFESFFFILLSALRIEEKTLTFGHQCLRNNIFREHTFVKTDLAEKYISIEIFPSCIRCDKRHCRQKTSIGHIALKSRGVTAESQTDRRVCCSKTRNTDLSVREPEEGFLICSGASSLSKRSKRKTLLVFEELCRNFLNLPPCCHGGFILTDRKLFRRDPRMDNPTERHFLHKMFAEDLFPVPPALSPTAS